MNSDQTRIADWQRVDFKHPDGLMTLKCHYGCCVDEFTVKGKPADEEEFGKHEDENPEYAQLPLCCGNMLFTAWDPDDDILKKYDKSKVGKELLDVTLQGRTLFTDGRWNTLCLPFDLTAEQLTNSQLAGFQIKELDVEAGTYDHITGYEADTKTLWLNFKDVTEIEAGKPYIAKNTIFPLEGSGIELKDIENPKFTTVKIDSSDPEGIKSTDETTTFQGVYDPVVITEKDRSVLFLQGEKLYYPDGKKPTTIGACRAYFPLDGIWGGVPDESSGVHSFVLNFGDGETAIEEIVNGKSSNGKSLDSWYSIDGRKLNQKPQQRGVYINNGRKVTIK